MIENSKEIQVYYVMCYVSAHHMCHVISLMSTGRLFQALGAATENARSDETSLDRGTTRSYLLAERREARPETLAKDVTNSVKYDGARPLIEWWTPRDRV